MMTIAIGRCAVLALCTTLAATSAFAHAGLEVKEATIGTSYKAVVKIGHGCEGTPTTKVTVSIPDGLIAVKPMPKPGWKLDTVSGPYAKAHPYYGGKELKEGVTEVSWSGGSLADSHYDEFVFTGLVSKNLTPDTTLYIPVVQECEKGSHKWTDIPAAGQDAHSLKSPAPGVRLVQAQHSGHSQPQAAATYKIGSLVIEAPWARATL